MNPWLKVLTEHPSEEMITNVKTRVFSLQTAQYTFPVTINDTQYDNSYVVSPYTALILYARDELVKIKNKFVQIVMSAFLTSIGKVCQWAKINKIVFVNNYLLSTNLYPGWQGEDIQKITSYLQQQYPDHLIAFRSLNDYQHHSLIKKFTLNSYHLMTSRQVYVFDQKRFPIDRKSNVIFDKKLLAKKDYQICRHHELTTEDYSRIVELYNLLYLEKYSYYNPQFTEAFIQQCHQQGLLTLFGLRNPQGTLDGIIGFFTIEQTTSAPLVGYDTIKPAKLGLYRRLMALALKYAKDNHLLLNLSSGAASFKRLRGGIPEIEYSAIYFQHLPLYRRLFWYFLLGITNGIAKPLLKRYEL